MLTGKRLAVVGAGVVVVAVVAVGLTLVLGGDDDPAYCGGPGDPASVYLVPGATPEQVADVGDALEELEVEHLTYAGVEQSFEEAQELFDDQPTMRELLRREDVPTSYRFSTDKATYERIIDDVDEPRDEVIDVNADAPGCPSRLGDDD